MVQRKRNSLGVSTLLQRLYPGEDIDVKDDNEGDPNDNEDDPDDTGDHKDPYWVIPDLSTSLFYTEEQISNTPKDLITSANKNWLLGTALRCKRITPEEYVASLEKQHVTIKRYLQTLVDPVKDADLLAAIDSYVRMASKIRAAGSRLLNLAAIWDYENECLDVKNTLLDQTYVKWGLLPFKGDVSGKSPRTVPTGSYPHLAKVWNISEWLLRPTYPSMPDLKQISWDQSLGDMAREYIGAFEAHVKTHFASRVCSIVKLRLQDFGLVIRRDTETGRSIGRLDGFSFFVADIYASLERAAAPEREFPPRVVQLIQEMRNAAGLGKTSRLSKVKVTNESFKLHIEMSREFERRGMKAFSACPMIKTHRTFAYLDERVMRGLMRGFGARSSKGVNVDWRNVLGIDRESWTVASKRSRAAKRKRSGKGSRRGLCGAASYPKQVGVGTTDWVAASASTDGVAICVTLQRPIDPVPPSPFATVDKPLKGRVKVSYMEACPGLCRQSGSSGHAWRGPLYCGGPWALHDVAGGTKEWLGVRSFQTDSTTVSKVELGGQTAGGGGGSPPEQTLTSIGVGNVVITQLQDHPSGQAECGSRCASNDG